MASIIVTSTDTGGVTTFSSRCLSNDDFWVDNIESSTWQSESGTGVSGYIKTNAISTFLSREWQAQQGIK